MARVLLLLVLLAGSAHADAKQAYWAAHDTLAAAPRAPRRALLAHLNDGITTDASAKRMYGADGAKVVAQLRTLGPGFDRLAVHPGLAMRVEAFARFVNEQHLTDPDRALDAFSKHLGTRTVYRALALTDAEHAHVLERGLESSFARHDHDLDLVMRPPPEVLISTRQPVVGDRVFAEPLAQHVSTRLSNAAGQSHHPLVSVTDHRDIAIAATTPFVSAGKSLHVYELRVPELDLFSTSALIPRRGPEKWIDITSATGSRRYAFASPEVESFLLLRVDPSEIVGHSIANETSTFSITQQDPNAKPLPLHLGR